MESGLGRGNTKETKTNYEIIAVLKERGKKGLELGE